MQQADPGSDSAPEPRRLIHKIRRGIVIYVLIPYLSVTVIFAVFQRKLIYQPTVSDDLSVEAVDEDSTFGRDLELQTPDGELEAIKRTMTFDSRDIEQDRN